MRPEVVTEREAFAAVASDAPPGARVPVAVRLSVDDPFAAYRRGRIGDGAGSAYLETTGGQPGWGYFGVDPIDRLTVEPSDGDALAALADRLAAENLVRGDCPVPYPCGAIGWLSYDVARELEGLPASTERDRDLPRLQLAVYDCLAAWEEPRGDAGGGGAGDGSRDGSRDRSGDGRGNAPSTASTTLWLTACPRVEDSGDPSAVDAAYDAGLRRVRWLADRIQSGDPGVGPAPVDAPTATFESDCPPTEFADRVRTVKDYVREGDTFQANVSQRLRAPAAVHPVAAFAALRQVNPAPYSALLEFPGVDLVSASPELLLAREGDRVTTEPIAGTRPRGETPDQDERFEQDLLTDEKERAEHAMLVDLERNDLGKVCTYGSVAVPEYRRVDRYAEVMHLVSLVEGCLRAGADLADAIRAVFPGGTITGAPKPRTMAIIDEVEATRRGPYTGSVGIFGFDERATLSIVIRTLVRYGDEYHLRVGAGIVHDSEPEREFAETMDKARALLSAVDAALDERTAVDLSRSP